MKIALGQLKIFWEDKKANMEKMKICLKQLSDVDSFLSGNESNRVFHDTEKRRKIRKRLYVRSGNWQDSMI